MIIKYFLVIFFSLILIDVVLYHFIIRPFLRRRHMECEEGYYQKKYREDLKTYNKINKNKINIAIVLVINSILLYSSIVFVFIYFFLS